MIIYKTILKSYLKEAEKKLEKRMENLDNLSSAEYPSEFPEYWIGRIDLLKILLDKT